MQNMANWILGGLCAAALFLAATGFTAYESNRYFTAAEATVYQMVNDSGAKGSAVVFADGRLFTAAHMFDTETGEEGWNIRKGDTDELIPIGKIEFIDYDADIAAFTAPVGCPCAPLGRKNLHKFQEVFALGHPEGVPFTVLTEGRLQGQDTVYHQLVTAHIARGSSGGAVFAIEDGRYVLVGITVYTRGQMVTTPFGRGGAPVNYMAGIVDLGTIKRALLCANGDSEDPFCGDLTP